MRRIGHKGRARGGSNADNRQSHKIHIRLNVFQHRRFTNGGLRLVRGI